MSENTPFISPSRVGKSIFSSLFFDFFKIKSDDAIVLEPNSKDAIPKESLPACKPKIRSKGKQKHNANAFLDWLHRDLEFGALSYNKPDSLVHFVPDGILLRTPQIFKEYLENNRFIGTLGKSKDPWRVLQRELQKSGLLIFNLAENTYFYRYELNSNKDNKFATSAKVATFYLLQHYTINLTSEPAMCTCVRQVIPSPKEPS